MYKRQVDGVLDSWSEIAKQSCSVSSITGFTSGDAKCLLDGKTSPGTCLLYTSKHKQVGQVKALCVTGYNNGCGY